MDAFKRRVNAFRFRNIKRIIKLNFMISRKAILLRYSGDDLEDFRSKLDIGLVKYFLQSAPGGCFEEDEIIEYKTNEIDADVILREIDQVEYSFVYFTGHADFIDRATWIPLKDNALIRVSDLQRKNKKQWFFFDCCRTRQALTHSPEFSFERKSIHFPICNEKARQYCMQDLVSLPNDLCITYYTTEMGKYAFVNEHGGYGTQLFFTTLSELLKIKKEVHLKELVLIINKEEDALQKGVLLSENAERVIFRN
jgi:hypothetical protein